MSTELTKPKSRRELVRELDERGCTGREIADLLGLTTSAVSYHLKNIRAEEKQSAEAAS